VFLAGTILLCLAVLNDILYVERVVDTGFFARSAFLSSSSPRRLSSTEDYEGLHVVETGASSCATRSNPTNRRSSTACASRRPCAKAKKIPHHSEQHPGRILRGRSERQHDVLQRFPMRDHRYSRTS